MSRRDQEIARTGNLPANSQSRVTKPSSPSSITAQRTEVQFESYSGPLPHPAILQQYESIYPGAAKEIFAAVATQAAHRQHLEKVVVESGVRRSYCGLAAALIVTLSFLGASTWLIHGGHDIAGTTLGSIDLVALVSVFLIGGKAVKEERIKKARIMTGQQESEGTDG